MNKFEIQDSKSAIIFGATGLVGNFVLKQLLEDEHYGEVKIFVRKSTGIKHSKLVESIIDFDKLENYRNEIKCDDFFCCLGTTIKTAGSENAFRRVDFDWVKWCAECASENGVKNFLVVSSLGADATSLNFYYRVKGEMEKVVMNLKFEKIVILRPSMLLGKRNELRLAELLGKVVMVGLSFLIPAKYKAIKAEVVARAMIKSANDERVKGILESDVIRKLGR
jgi:uncharacterized protein YbjT (DUF2867 family)